MAPSLWKSFLSLKTLSKPPQQAIKETGNLLLQIRPESLSRSEEITIFELWMRLMLVHNNGE
jgi:hypothetical protein